MIRKVAFGLIGLSYSYGFCRSWTLPIWSDIPKSSIREVSIRLIISSIMGFSYVLPPLCIIKYAELGLRLEDTRRGYTKIHPPGNHWKEWDFYHPRAF